MKLHRIKTIFGVGLMVAAPAIMAEEFSTGTPKPETLSEAVRFEKYKMTSAEVQAKKDAAEQRAASQSTTAGRKTVTAKSNTPDRKTGQGDAAKK